MAELSGDYTALAWIQGLTALFWFGGALAALRHYRGIREPSYLAWMAITLILAAVRAGDAYVAAAWSDQAPFLPPGLRLAEFTSYYELRLGALEMVAALAALLILRRRP